MTFSSAFYLTAVYLTHFVTIFIHLRQLTIKWIEATLLVETDNRLAVNSKNETKADFGLNPTDVDFRVSNRPQVRIGESVRIADRDARGKSVSLCQQKCCGRE